MCQNQDGFLILANWLYQSIPVTANIFGWKPWETSLKYIWKQITTAEHVYHINTTSVIMATSYVLLFKNLSIKHVMVILHERNKDWNPE